MLAGDVSRGCLDSFLPPVLSLFLPIRHGDKSEILSQRAVKPKSINRPASF